MSVRFADAAASIARRLAADAAWDGGRCTWTVNAPDPSAAPGERRSIETPAGATLYSGTAGIALFLAAVHAHRPDAEVERAALGGIRHALDGAAEIAGSVFGLHSGVVGVAWAASEVARMLGRPELGVEGAALLAPLAGRAGEDAGLDVIAGAAGAIPALLRLAEREGGETARDLAVDLGRHLVRSAEREPEGWSWSTLRHSSSRNLAGYAHGTAGVAHALLELAAATGDGAFRHAAEQAMRYERAFFDADRGNWADLRHPGMLDYTGPAGVEALRARLAAGGEIEPYHPVFMAAWCHGAPGIGLQRVRAWALLGDDALRGEVEAAVRGTVAALDVEGGNWSLCHGHAGNAWALLEMADALGRDDLRADVERTTLGAVERWEEAGRRWPCGTMGGVPDPGLMLGEAGTGLFLLHLAGADVPPILRLDAPSVDGMPGADSAGAEAERGATLEAHWGRTLRAWRALGEDVDALLAAPDPLALRDAVGARLAAETDAARRALLADAAALDRAALELATAQADFVRQTTAPLSAAARDPDAGRWSLAPHLRVVRGARDWDGWLAGGADGAPDEAPVFHLLHARGRRVEARRLGPLPALVLSSLDGGADAAASARRVAEAVEGADAARLEPQVAAQLREAHRAGMLVPADPLP